MTFVFKIVGSECGRHIKQTFLTFKLFLGSFSLGVISASFFFLVSKRQTVKPPEEAARRLGSPTSNILFVFKLIKTSCHSNRQC